MRRTRTPEYDLQKHLVTGKRGPQSGTGIQREVDDDTIDRDDPMEFTAGNGQFSSRTAGDILDGYLRDASGLDSAAGANGDAIDVKAVSNQDNNEPAGSAYGAIPGNRR